MLQLSHAIASMLQLLLCNIAEISALLKRLHATNENKNVTPRFQGLVARRLVSYTRATATNKGGLSLTKIILKFASTIIDHRPLLPLLLSCSHAKRVNSWLPALWKQYGTCFVSLQRLLWQMRHCRDCCDVAEISVMLHLSHTIAAMLHLSHLIAATLQRLQNIRSTTVWILENTPGTRSGTESLPQVFLHNTFEQIYY